MNKNNLIIKTIKEKCKTCYTCVRECPAKAISIISGQAEICPDRCINCGNCVKVCNQNAKIFYNSVDDVYELLSSSSKVAAIIAPSFPAIINNINYKKFVGALKQIGFDYVNEVAAGADFVAEEYKKILNNNCSKTYISSSCPSVVSYVEKYYPEFVSSIVPVVSPMIATSRLLKFIYGNDLKIVFIGPCIAKKQEILRDEFKNEVNAVLTFTELEKILLDKQISIQDAKEQEFDKPFSYCGSLFAINGGIFYTADIQEDLFEENITLASGKTNFVEALKELRSGDLNTKLLESLSCEGCILGPGISNKIPLYKKRHLISKHAKLKKDNTNLSEWNESKNKLKAINLSCNFKEDVVNVTLPPEKIITTILKKLGKFEPNDELNCGACGYHNCREHAIAIIQGFAEAEMCMPYTIEQLKKTISDLQNSYKELKTIRKVLNHRERLADMGQLAAGIAHEINNPLGVILMYSDILLEQIKGDSEQLDDIKVISEQANRCKKIVSGLLNFSRQDKLDKQEHQVNQIVKHCLDSIIIPENISAKISSNVDRIIANIDKEQFSQVIINVVNNSIDAMDIDGGNIDIILEDKIDYFAIKIIDSGAGIPEKFHKQIFDPFFTTKQIGKGTGLGLSLSYGIVKMHNGSISIESNTDATKGCTGTTVKIEIPK